LIFSSPQSDRAANDVRFDIFPAHLRPIDTGCDFMKLRDVSRDHDFGIKFFENLARDSARRDPANRFARGRAAAALPISIPYLAS